MNQTCAIGRELEKLSSTRVAGQGDLGRFIGVCVRLKGVEWRPRAADQGIVRAVVEAANCLVVISVLVDLETSSQEKLRGKLFDCEPDGVSRVPKSSVANGPPPGFLLATGEQLRCGVIIEFDYGVFDRGVFDRHLSGRDFFYHNYNVLLSFD